MKKLLVVASLSALAMAAKCGGEKKEETKTQEEFPVKEESQVPAEEVPSYEQQEAPAPTEGTPAPAGDMSPTDSTPAPTEGTPAP